MREFGASVDVFDPWADTDEAERAYGIQTVPTPDLSAYDGILISVAHDIFREMSSAQVRDYGKDNHVLFDLKSMLPKHQSDIRL